MYIKLLIHFMKYFKTVKCSFIVFLSIEKRKKISICLLSTYKLLQKLYEKGIHIQSFC